MNNKICEKITQSDTMRHLIIAIPHFKTLKKKNRYICALINWVLQFGSCDPSICWAHSLLCVICHSIVHNCGYKNSFYSIICWLSRIYWLHEQFGPLQFRVHSKGHLLSISLPKISHVHTIVSFYYLLTLSIIFYLCSCLCIIKKN